MIQQTSCLKSSPLEEVHGHPAVPMLPPVMALNGPSVPEIPPHLDLDTASESPPSYSPTLRTSPSDSPVPVSPGKKRVRISDSTSVRLIEDHPVSHSEWSGREQRQYQSYYVQFNSDYINKANAAISDSPRIKRDPRVSGSEAVGETVSTRDFVSTVRDTARSRETSGTETAGARETVSSMEESTGCRVTREAAESTRDSTVITRQPPSLKETQANNKPTSTSETRNRVRESSQVVRWAEDTETKECRGEYTEGSAVEYPKYKEYVCNVDAVTFPDNLPSTAVPQPSLESRDNPFLPGGDLSKEAEDLLSKATIVRDKFYLHQERHQQQQQPQQQQHSLPPTDSGRGDTPDGTLLNNTNGSPGVLEDRITPTTASEAEAAAPEAHPRENGKAADGVASPDGVRVDVGGSPTSGGKEGLNSDSAGDLDKDKAKRRPKCCVVM